jgi:uncharacterized membrane protein
LPQSTILAISLFFHLLATVIWVGGLVITTVLVWPAVRRTLADTPALYSVLGQFRQRFTPWGNLCLVVLIVTGLFQMSLDENYNGLLDFSNTWSVVILMKHIAIIGMIGIGVIMQYGIFPALERNSLLLEREKGNPEVWSRLRQREIRLTWLNTLLGIAVLGFSAWAGVL